MNRMAKTAAVALAFASGLALAGCSGGSPTTTPSTSDTGSSTATTEAPVTMTLWHNGTGDKSQLYWQDVIRAFEAQYPNVTVDVQVVQNEDLDGKLQTAMQAGTPPDIFLQRGGGKLQDMINAGMVQDITSSVSSDITTNMSAALGLNTIDGKVYAMPMSFQPEGLWYNQDLFTKAGITTNPTDMTSFNAAVSSLKAASIAPIALGAQDAWPAAHWFYSFALRECSQQVVQSLTAAGQDLSDPCWLKAIQDVQTLANTQPFNNNFLSTVAQQGAASSAGLVANGQASMELMGAWEPGVIGDLTPDKNPLASLRFFPFPAVDGGQGDPSAMMAGSDGYSCSSKAPEPACTNFLNFIGQKSWVEQYATAYTTMPSRTDAAEVVTDQSLQEAMQAYSNAKYVVLWFDTSLGSDVGNAVNQQIVNLLAGQTDPAGALAAMQAAIKAG